MTIDSDTEQSALQVPRYTSLSLVKESEPENLIIAGNQSLSSTLKFNGRSQLTDFILMAIEYDRQIKTRT